MRSTTPSLSRRDGAWRATVLTLALALGAANAAAQIYVGANSSGTLVLSNHASDNAATLLLAAEATLAQPARSATAVAVKPVVTPQPLRAAPKAMEALIQDIARQHALSATLLTAVIAVESDFDTRAVSPKGAKGLMQLMPATARRFGVKDVFAPHDNLNGGAAYLRQLILLFENDLSLALAAYNAGESAVLRAGRRIPPYPETQQYVAKVLAHAGDAAARSLKAR